MAGEVDDNITVVVVEEHEIVRRGLVASLEEDQRLRVASASPETPLPAGVDVAVVSSRAAARTVFPCPIVVCADTLHHADAVAATNTVAGVLVRKTLTGAQLRATVHAAAAGLRVQVGRTNGNGHHDTESVALEPRATRLLELLAEGLSTREIAVHMSYSERTIKKLITALEHRFAARNRAQIVAQAIRSGLI